MCTGVCPWGQGSPWYGVCQRAALVQYTGIRQDGCISGWVSMQPDSKVSGPFQDATAANTVRALEGGTRPAHGGNREGSWTLGGKSETGIRLFALE